MDYLYQYFSDGVSVWDISEAVDCLPEHTPNQSSLTHI